MRRKINIIIVLQLTQIFILATVLILLSSCATMNGLHYPNGARNVTAKWQQSIEQSNHIVK